ncbi:hypothetical protein BGX29_000350 [Mortierella sp. GBA35]|nr:hypothetical protein BGX29_000350 [Mortierella sp. GBA35]KAG0199687.1 hypothetical protein BGX33_011496 [Mortierella sp. NVP41]
MEMIPDLTHYAEGLGSETFPLQVTAQKDTITNSASTIDDDNDSVLAVKFVVVTLEKGTAEITLDGQGFGVISFSALSEDNNSNLQLSTRQQEAISGHVYETIEALLMALSPAFEAFFGQELSKKLENVSWDQSRFQRFSDDSADESSDDHSDNIHNR